MLAYNFEMPAAKKVGSDITLSSEWETVSCILKTNKRCRQFWHFILPRKQMLTWELLSILLPNDKQKSEL
jgi:hypothetical protein